MPDVPASTFLDFADHEARGVSALYDRLAREVAARASLRNMLGAAPPNHRRATLFFAAIHDVVLEQNGTYPADGPALEAFCAANYGAIIARIASRRTQTNEVARSAQLIPSLAAVSAMAEGTPTILEVGASAGLNLRFDSYRYTYRILGQAVSVGDAASSVDIECSFEGHRRVIPSAIPTVGQRIGLDAEPVDLADAQQVRWLRACVWADEADRAARLSAAVTLVRRDPPLVLRGDAIDNLDSAARHLPSDVPMVIVHQALMAYLSTRDRVRFRHAVKALARRRPVYWLFVESPTAAGTLADVAPPPDGRTQHVVVLADLTRAQRPAVVLAVADPHGRWLRWVASGSRKRD